MSDDRDSNNPFGGDDIPLSRKDVLRLGLRRVKEASAHAAGIALESYANRFAPHVIRPPGAVAEVEFLLACTRCDECIKACPPNALLKLDHRAGAASGTPFLDPNRHRPCIACADPPCMKACPTEALLITPIAEAVMGTAVIDRDTCLPWKETAACNRCYNVCPFKEDAILQDEDGRPYVDPRHCIGCGLCRAACPTKPRSVEIEAGPRF